MRASHQAIHHGRRRTARPRWRGASLSPAAPSPSIGAELDELVPHHRPPGQWLWLGRMSFERAAQLQERLRAEVLDGRREETLLLLEHDPVITLGRRANPENVLLSEAALATQGITLARCTRGGDVTYHGPGQLIGYPIVRLRSGVRAHVRGMAAALTDTLAEWGIHAHYREDVPGVWVARPSPSPVSSSPSLPGADAPAKIAAFGINVHHRVAIHGFALNITASCLDPFSGIVPCGLAGSAVTSVERLVGVAPALSDCAERVALTLAARLGIAFRRIETASELLCETTSLE